MSVKLHRPNGSPITAEVEDNNDGTYTASFTPVSRGDHQITIYARGKPIQGSPFDLQVCLLLESFSHFTSRLVLLLLTFYADLR